jgi:hypothetical protein
MLFRDGFESGDLSRWTSMDGLGVDDALVYSGTFGARSTSTGNPSSAWLQLESELFAEGNRQRRPRVDARPGFVRQIGTQPDVRTPLPVDVVDTGQPGLVGDGTDEDAANERRQPGDRYSGQAHDPAVRGGDAAAARQAGDPGHPAITRCQPGAGTPAHFD